MVERFVDAIHGGMLDLDVLDVGCGEGIVRRALATARARMVGVDPSRTLVAHAEAAERALPVGVAYRNDDGTTLPTVADGSVDGVPAALSLNNIADLDAALGSIRRVLLAWFGVEAVRFGQAGDPPSSRTENRDHTPPPLQRLAAPLISCTPHPLTWRRRHSARSSVDAMGLFSHEEFRDPDEGAAGGASGGAVERARGADIDEFGSDHPVVVGPGLPPEDGSCGQFAVQFHVSTSMLVGLKRIADMRGVSVPEVCRQVIGVFVAQQEGELSALLAAEAEVTDYRPSLDDA